MKKLWTLILFISISISCFSQVNFEPGYFITNEGQKVTGLIKNLDWIHNPDQIVFKSAESSEAKIVSIDEMMEFNIDDKSKYVKFYLEIDRSSNELTNLSDHGYPDFEKDTLLLKCLVEGKANLYQYSESKGKLIRFFYTTPNIKIEQLVYKVYSFKANELHTNQNYRNQLRSNVSCGKMVDFPYKRLNYKPDPLTNYFINYNECNGSEFTNHNKVRERQDWNLNIRPGINYSTMSITAYSPIVTEYPLKSKICPRVGVELEYVLPFKNNKWAIILEPTYQYYNGEADTFEGLIEANYTSFEIPLGLRHSFFLNDQSKIFINAQYTFDLPLDSYISFENRGNLEIQHSTNIIGGIGFQRNKIMLEIRGSFNRNSLSNYVFFNSKYNYISMTFGYTLF